MKHKFIEAKHGTGFFHMPILPEYITAKTIKLA